MRKRRVVVLGATGSIGQSAARVAADLPERMEIVGLAAHRNAAASPRRRTAFDPRRSASWMTRRPTNSAASLAPATIRACFSARRVWWNWPSTPDADIVLVAIVGTGGLRPALAAIEAGRDLAVASKEILVMAGETVMGAAAARGVRILPVDSEHNAIFQCLEGRDPATVRRLILTASGGPFRQATANRSPPPRPRRRSNTRPGTWAGRSPSTRPRSSTRGWK